MKLHTDKTAPGRDEAGGDTARTGPLRLDFQSGQDLTAPLTWGQRSMWTPIQWFGDEARQFNLKRTLLLPEPLGQEWVSVALRGLIEAHQTARSRYVQSEQGPRQEVVAAGRYDIAVVVEPADPAAAADDLAGALAATAFDHRTEWPLRVGWVLDAQARVTAVALVGSHLAFDGWAMERFGAQLQDLLAPGSADAPNSSDAIDASGTTDSADTSAVSTTSTASTASAASGSAAVLTRASVSQLAAGCWQPVDQAAYEQSPAGKHKAERVLRHWQERLSIAPASMFDLPAAPVGELPMEKYRFESAAVVPAACAVAARTGTTVSNVLLSLSALILTAYNGHDVCTMKLIVGNRYDRRSRELIAINAQDGLLAVPMPAPETDLLTAVRELYRPGLAAYHRGQCDPFELDALVQESARRRGVWFDLSAYFNDGRRSSDWPAIEPEGLGRASLDRLRRRSRFWRSDRLGKGDMKYCVSVADLGDGWCRLALLADTAFFPPPLGETVLRGIESLLCDAVAGEVAVSEIPQRIGLTPARRGPQWVRVDTGWVLPHEVAALVRAAAGGAQTAVFAQPSPDSAEISRLTAYVAVGDRGSSPDSLHHAVLAELAGKLGVAAPAQYVLCDRAPAAGSGATLNDWQNTTVLARGSGRPAATD